MNKFENETQQKYMKKKAKNSKINKKYKISNMKMTEFVETIKQLIKD